MAQAYDENKFHDPQTAEKPDENTAAGSSRENKVSGTGVVSDSSLEIAARITRLMMEAPPVISELPPSSVAISIPEDPVALGKIFKSTGLTTVDEILQRFKLIAKESDLEIGIQVNIFHRGIMVIMTKKQGVTYRIRISDQNAAFIRHFSYQLY